MTADAHDKLAPHMPLGSLVTDVDGHTWVFCGWAKTTTSKTACFVRSVHERSLGERIWTYTASSYDTLLKKFPDIANLTRD